MNDAAGRQAPRPVARPTPFLLFLRMLVRYFAVAIRILTMALRRVGVLFAFFVLAVIVVVSRLAMMMRGRVMGRGGVVMMLAGRVFLLRCHWNSFHKTKSATAVANPSAIPMAESEVVTDASLPTIKQTARRSWRLGRAFNPLGKA
jgi:ABC-type transport system involved in cytochrome bd biosynthesis fused ATPase/permease subunit